MLGPVWTTKNQNDCLRRQNVWKVISSSNISEPFKLLHMVIGKVQLAHVRAWKRLGSSIEYYAWSSACNGTATSALVVMLDFSWSSAMLSNLFFRSSLSNVTFVRFSDNLST